MFSYSFLGIYCDVKRAQSIVSQYTDVTVVNGERLEAMLMWAPKLSDSLADELNQVLTQAGISHEIHVTPYIAGKKKETRVIAPEEAVLV